MLRGMGWQEGKGVKGKAPVKPIEFIPRQRGLGLGAKPTFDDAADKRPLKPGETRGSKDLMARFSSPARLLSFRPACFPAPVLPSPRGCASSPLCFFIPMPRWSDLADQ